MKDLRCPCGGEEYQLCCGPYHQGAIAKHPELLMRSRYSAFALGIWQYLIDTHHPDYLNGLTVKQLANGGIASWKGLQVFESSANGDSGEVFFCAWYKENGKLDAICERSAFVRYDNRWFYTEGKHYAVRAPGRNDPCVCHSGKKAKQCCLK
ncbi:YchJ family protein [Shewanella sp.]|uniref:YchJ family protein n=1 Tax=Shewanella sp. TaxID=50422 RepID=UPI003564CE36